MKYSIKRGGEPKEIDKIEIFIEDRKYKLTETVDGKLELQKSTTGNTEEIIVFPKVSNVIDVV